MASPVGTNASILAALGLPGADSPGEWLDIVSGILAIPEDERAALGRGARERVMEQYSYDAWMERWQQAMGLSQASSNGFVGDPR